MDRPDYREENNIEKPQQIVVCAAIKYKGLIICGARHFDNVMMQQIESTKESCLPEHGSLWEQGFIDQFGKYLNRDEAIQIVEDSGQTFNAERNGGDAGLFSEGLY